MTHKFTYTCEEDKGYGLTGMAMALMVWDNHDMLRHISLDAAEGESIAFTPEFYFCSNPRYSAKIAWKEMLKQYQTLTSLVIGNILCRQLAWHHEPLTPAMTADIYSLVEEEGRDDCGLEDDEIRSVFSNTLGELQRVMSSRHVQDILTKFVAELRRRRTMSGSEVVEQINLLHHQ